MTTSYKSPINRCCILDVIQLTNRFHVSVHLFSNRSQITPHVPRMFLPDFDFFCDLLLNRHTATWNLFVLYNNEKPVLFQNISIFQYNAKAGLCPAFAHFGEDKKKSFDIIFDLYKMKQFHWLLCVAKNCDCRGK